MDRLSMFVDQHDESERLALGLPTNRRDRLEMLRDWEKGWFQAESKA